MHMRTLTPILMGLLISGCAVAQAPKAEEDHSAHHPPEGAAAAQAPSADAGRPAPAPDAFDRQLKSMQDMHQRMQAAKTPAERAALMDEHMKLMQSGMAMMGQLRGGTGGGMSSMPGMGMGAGRGMGTAPPAGQAAPATPPGPSPGMGGMMGMHERMERRMAMMEQMMQMMVDREGSAPRR